MRRIFLPILLAVTASCSTSRLAVPEQFSSQATRYPVKGAKVQHINQHLSFGNYTTSRIKRGWNLASGVKYSNSWISPQEVLLNMHGITSMTERNNEKSRFRYTLTNDQHSAEIFCTEIYDSHELKFKALHIPQWTGETSTQLNFNYAFSAAMIPSDTSKLGLWSLLMVSRYDIAADTARRIFDRPYVAEEGYATNGRDTIRIRSLNLNTFANKKGKVSKTLLGAKILSGYELSTADGVIGIIDTMDKALWIYNEQEEQLKFILSAMGTAILLKQVENPEDKTTI
ncbi:hypothetical protein [Chitinophaga rhizophila]|uniref:DUF3108 domain-containing protein n=1 Tax=Chitinophaga rhizophila TaxID=2866212 RepID=A0ABS7GBB3_9BACT|nr:hypothetical protein [Chitinophaga rhizophila]MBW8684963.1 hypothetical protein [Chitinophaga rhizophila]